MRGLEELSRLSKDERFAAMAVRDRIAVDATFDEATKIAGMIGRRMTWNVEAVLADDKVYLRRTR